MTYLERREEAYTHPRHVLDGVRSVVMLGINYNTQPTDGERVEGRREETSSTGDRAGDGTVTCDGNAGARRPVRTGRADYHDVIREKLRSWRSFVQRESPGCKARGSSIRPRCSNAISPRLAGLGWFGKNTMLINKRLGSWFFLAALLVDLELEYDAPHTASHCGTCTRCLDACPTGAFVEPYVLDARRCISYLTIEHRGPIPEELHAGMGDWLFGCDICQEVCPWNRKAPISSEPDFQPQPALQSADAAALMKLTEAEFREQFGHTALTRPGHAGLVRNAAIVAANFRTSTDL